MRLRIKAALGAMGLAALTLAAGAPAAAAPDVGAMTRAELTAFTQAFPKGGELHNHIGGAAFPEHLLAWAVEDGLCVETATLSTRGCDGAGEMKPAAQVLADDVLRSALYDSFSTRHPGFAGRSGHDQFFSAFARRGTKPARSGDELAVVMDDLARQNTFYLEAMVTPQGLQSRALGARVGWKGGDLAAQAQANAAAGLAEVVAGAVAQTDALEARAREVLKCGAPEARPGCQVTVRYLVQTIRTVPPEQLFAQLQMGVELVAADRRWVGLQMVAPEDHPISLRDYSLHMQMVGFLTEGGAKAPAALHAGELTLDIATPADLSFHIAEAVRVAGARRIGHGIDLPSEAGAEALAAEMADKGVLVEVNLSSNAVILEVEGEGHPYRWLKARGVPVSLSTDDAGILRIDLSHEYARAVIEQGAGYRDLVASARNALAFSFLAGDGLWEDPGVYRRPARACRGQIGKAEARPGPCADLLAASDKAREQWRHEAALAAFEARTR